MKQRSTVRTEKDKVVSVFALFRKTSGSLYNGGAQVDDIIKLMTKYRHEPCLF